MMQNKPKIGLLGLMTDGYEEVFPGIMDRQKKHGEKIAASLSAHMDVVFEQIAANRAEIEAVTADYNARKLDGILIVLLAYSQGAWLTRAMKENNLPLAVAVLQPDDVVREGFDELDLTVNQGIHGTQDNCNVLMRLGLTYQVFAGSAGSNAFKDFVLDFGKAAQAAMELKKLRVGVIGRMQGMGDILTDEMAVYKKFGVEICHDSLGSVYRQISSLTAAEIDAEIEKDLERFEVDPALSRESHSIAAAQYLGFRRYLEVNEYGAFTAHFDMFGQDGRFRQLPLYAASRLLADGYGYAAEGDLICAAMVRAGHILSGRPANFTEMYMMDEKTQSLIFCHAGEGNYLSAAEGRKPRLIDRYLGEGGLENPPTILFMPEPGKATLASLVSVDGENFRLLVSRGEILDKDDMERCEMPYFFYRPGTGVKPCVERWLSLGGTHHEVICLGDAAERFRMFCEITGIEYEEV